MNGEARRSARNPFRFHTCADVIRPSKRMRHKRWNKNKRSTWNRMNGFFGVRVTLMTTATTVFNDGNDEIKQICIWKLSIMYLLYVLFYDFFIFDCADMVPWLTDAWTADRHSTIQCNTIVSIYIWKCAVCAIADDSHAFHSFCAHLPNSLPFIFYSFRCASFYLIFNIACAIRTHWREKTKIMQKVKN